MSVQNKISIFNKPNIDETEVMKNQIKKAKFLAKLSKFENMNDAEEQSKPRKKSSSVLRSVEAIENADKADELEQKKLEEEQRKLSFEQIKGQFLVIEKNGKADKKEKRESIGSAGEETHSNDDLHSSKDEASSEEDPEMSLSSLELGENSL